MKKIAIRLDVGKSIGAGHLIRCTALADALSEMSDCEIIFLCRNKVSIHLNYRIVYLKNPYITNVSCYEFPSIIDEIAELKSILMIEKIDCLIVDHYGAKDDYFYKLYEAVKYLVCIDDRIRRSISVDAVVNGNIYGKDSDYTQAGLQLTGSRYMLIRSMFQNVKPRKNREVVQEIYITSGGSDPCGFCKRISDALINSFQNINLHVIVGSDFMEDYVDELQQRKILLHKNANMKNCMELADFFVSGAGSTLYELAACGVPSISYVLADDQRLLAEYMHNEGTTYVGGTFENFDEKEFVQFCRMFFFDKGKRDDMSKAGQMTIDGFGARRVAEELLCHM